MTSIQLPYRLLQDAAVMWLAGLNSRRFRVNLPLIAAYIAGLLWTRGRATCAAIGLGGAVSHDALNRLLKGPSLRGVLQMAALALVERTQGYLVIDDVVWGKRGKKIPGTAKLYAPGPGQYVTGFNVVVLAWTNGKGLVVPLSFRFWKPPAWRTGTGRSVFAFDNTSMRTKHALAVELLDWAYATGFRPTAVLFDGYYLAAPVLRYLAHRRWHWVTRLKTNRVLKYGGRKFKPKDWETDAAAGLMPSMAHSLHVVLPGWGEVRMIASRIKADGTIRYLAASNPNWGKGRIDALYAHRWCIEHAVFRDGKQLAGLEDCQCRSWRAQENHFALVLLAEVFLGDQARPADSTADVIRRIGDRPVALLKAPVPVKVRPIGLRRKRRGRKPHPVKLSGCSA